MDPSRPNRILDDWAAVASEARRPSGAPRPVAVRSGLPGATLAGASLIVVGLFFAGVLLGRPGPNTTVGTSPSPQGPVTSDPSASPSSSGGLCRPEDVDARITIWEGAAGSRIATLELKQIGSAPCGLETMAKPQLVNGSGEVLIEGTAPARTTTIRFAPGEVVTTLVRTSNYCRPAPQPPVTVDFVTSYDALFMATPPSPTDTTLPPCNGTPGSAGTIEMQPWAR